MRSLPAQGGWASKDIFVKTSRRRAWISIFSKAGTAAFSLWTFSKMTSRTCRVNACAMVRADRATELSQIFDLHPDLKDRSRQWQPLMDPVSTSPLIFRKPSPTRDGMFLVGDAAAFVDPFIGDGISLALRSGALASECLASSATVSLALQAYSRRYEVELGPIFRASSTLRRILALPAVVRKPGLVLLNSSPRLKQYIVSRTRRVS